MNNLWVLTSQVVAEEDLHAYIDGELSQDRRVAVAQYLSACPDVARRVDAYAAQRDLLRAELAGPAKETVPPQLDLKRLIGERRKQLSRRHPPPPAPRPAAVEPLIPTRAHAVAGREY
jgi:anti-sigma factor RsiW